jgi:hypothetical protein
VSKHYRSLSSSSSPEPVKKRKAEKWQSADKPKTAGKAKAATGVKSYHKGDLRRALGLNKAEALKQATFHQQMALKLMENTDDED